MRELWVEKYKPTKLDDIVGNDSQIQKIREWDEDWDHNTDPLLLYGPPGVGKTSAAEALAQEKGYQIKSINASDDRSSSKISDVVGGSSQTMGFEGGQKLIVVDEVDNMDAGGTRSLNKAIKGATQRIILIGNDYYDGISRSLRNNCTDVEFEGPDNGDLANFLMDVLKTEGVQFNRKSLKKIIRACDGDIRAMLTDAQACVSYEYEKITLDSIDHTPEKKAVFVGDNGVDKSGVFDALDTWIDPSEYSEWVIRGVTEFELSVGEYALFHGIPLKLEAATHTRELSEGWGWTLGVHGDENRERLKYIRRNSEYSVVFEPHHEYTTEEYMRWLLPSYHDNVLYTWLTGRNPEAVNIWERFDGEKYDISR